MDRKLNPYKYRLNVVNNFLRELSKEFGPCFSAALCGSMVIETPRENSDIDMFFVIESKNLRKFVHTKSFKDIFHLTIQDNLEEEFCSGNYHLYRPSDNNIKGIKLSINILSLPYCKKLANMEEFLVQKFRLKPRYETLQYRGFGYIDGQSTYPFDPIIKKGDGGYRTQVMSLIRKNGETYFHINAEKFFTAYFLIDHLGIKKLQNIFRAKMYKEFLKTKHKDQYGFLLKRKLANPEQLQKLKSSLTKNYRKEKTNKKFSLKEIEKWGKRIIVISGPPGVGKDTIVEKCIAESPKIKYFIPVTTRKPRSGEIDTKYHFESEKNFKEQRAKDEFLYWQCNGKDMKGNLKYYGILNSNLRKELSESNKDIAITVGGTYGALKIKGVFPQATTIFVNPTSFKALKQQLKERATESEEEIETKLNEGRAIMNHRDLYDFKVTNIYGQLNKTVKNFLEII